MSKLNTLLLRECLTDEEREKIKKYWRGNIPPEIVTGSRILVYAFPWSSTEEGGGFWLDIYLRLAEEERESISNIKKFDLK